MRLLLFLSIFITSLLQIQAQEARIDTINYNTFTNRYGFDLGYKTKLIHRNYWSVHGQMTSFIGDDDDFWISCYFDAPMNNAYDTVYMKNDASGGVFYAEKIATYHDMIGNASFEYYYPNGQLKKTVDYSSIKSHDTIIQESLFSEEAGMMDTSIHHSGIVNGWAKTYYQNGQLAKSIYYDMGKKEGTYSSFYFNGQKKEKGIYEQDCPVGIWKLWYENGQLKSQVPYDKCRPHGVVFSWYPNGQLAEEKEYYWGNITGSPRIYYENGNLLGVENTAIKKKKKSIEKDAEERYAAFQNEEYPIQGTMHIGRWKLEGMDIRKRAEQEAFIAHYWSVRHGEYKYYREGGSLLIKEKYMNDKLVRRKTYGSEEEIDRFLHPENYNSCNAKIMVKLPYHEMGGGKRDICLFRDDLPTIDTNQIEIIRPMSDSIELFTEVIHIENKLGLSKYQLFYPDGQKLVEMNISERTFMKNFEGGDRRMNSDAILFGWERYWYPNGKIRWERFHHTYMAERKEPYSDKAKQFLESQVDTMYYFFPNGRLQFLQERGSCLREEQECTNCYTEKEWYKNGNFKLEEYYWTVDNYTYHKRKIYFENGQVKFVVNRRSKIIEGGTSDAKKHGWQEKYNKNGDLLLKERYDSGQLVEKIK